MRDIVAALLVCLERYGYAGTTLEKVASVSGMSRSHIRHYVGNRETLLTVGAEFFFVQEDLPPTPGEGLDEQRRTVLEWLFGDEFVEPGRPNKIVRAFFDASVDYPSISEVVGKSYEHRRAAIVAVLERAAPSADRETILRRASVILLLALGNAYMADVDFDYITHGYARETAEVLLGADLSEQ